jgi:dehydrogenase/reductase SDR family member 7B
VHYKDKVVWITGASSGLGEALAYEFSKAEARLIISGRNTEELNKLKNNLKRSERDILVLPLDLLQTDTFSGKTAEAINHFGRIDYLVNNAGISQRALAKDAIFAVDEQIIKINLLGTIGLTKCVIPYMLRQKEGYIAVISSITGKIGVPYRTAYSASKHGLHGYFNSLRAELHDRNIKVSIICPGYLNTNISKNALTGTGEKLNSSDETIAKGMNPGYCAAKILNSLAVNKQEIIIAGWREKAGLFISRYFPYLYSIIIRKVRTR